MAPPRQDPLARFKSKVAEPDENGCWLWTAGRFDQGYGQFWFDGAPRHAHRWFYELTRGPVPDGLVLDHLCRVRHCVNPDHLEPVTCQENLRRGTGWPGRNAQKTHCKHGHELTAENVKPNAKGWRICLTCARRIGRETQRRNRERLRSAKDVRSSL